MTISVPRSPRHLPVAGPRGRGLHGSGAAVPVPPGGQHGGAAQGDPAQRVHPHHRRPADRLVDIRAVTIFRDIFTTGEST